MSFRPQEDEPGYMSADEISYNLVCDEYSEFEVVVYTNTCYICKKVFQDTEGSEVCSQACLDFETAADVCGNKTCEKLYILDPCEPSNYCSDDCCFEASQATKVRVPA